MKIKKYKKLKHNMYQIFFEEASYTFYEEVILKHQLLLKKQIHSQELDVMLKENSYYEFYYEGILYLEKKLRTKKEVEEYLKTKCSEDNIINKVIEHLLKEGYINDEIYIESFISDAIKFRSDGPLKIKHQLLLKGLDESRIDFYLENIDDFVWQEKLNALILKKVSSNHKDSELLLKHKLKQYCYSKGYPMEFLNAPIDSLRISKDQDILKKEVEKIKRKLERKFEGKDLIWQMTIKLYQKGFSKNDIDEVLKKEDV